MTNSVTAPGRRFLIGLMVLGLALVLGTTSCTGSGEDLATDTSDVTDGGAAGSNDGDGSPSAATGDGAGSSGSTGSREPEAEERARAALGDLLTALAAGDYRTAGPLLFNEGISPDVVRQIGLAGERDAYDPETLQEALAHYCAAVNCAADVAVGPVTRSDEFSVTLVVTVERPEGDKTLEIPLTSFEGRFTVGLLPFGKKDDGAADDAGPTAQPTTTLVDRVPFYAGQDSVDGWRLAPEGSVDPIVSLWDGSRLRLPGHVPGYSVAATGDFGELAVLSDGLVFQKRLVPLDDSGTVDDTIWLQRGGDEPTAFVDAPAGQFITLVGARFIDWGEDVVYYQIRSGTMPEDTKSRLYGKNSLTGEVTEIAVIGGWESGISFDDVNAAYPLVAGMWGAEGYAGPVIVDFATGRTVYDADRVGQSCFVGDLGCPAYWAVTMVDGLLYGIRHSVEESGEPTAFSLFRFDPDTADEVEVARFAWAAGVWFPRSLLAVFGDSVIISVEDGDGNALPAVQVDVDNGAAFTLSRTGFAAPGYLT